MLVTSTISAVSADLVQFYHKSATVELSLLAHPCFRHTLGALFRKDLGGTYIVFLALG